MQMSPGAKAALCPGEDWLPLSARGLQRFKPKRLKMSRHRQIYVK
jgi:hypothetical protein